MTKAKGLGSRHFAGAAIGNKNTKAIAVVASQSSGTMQIFQNGEVALRPKHNILLDRTATACDDLQKLEKEQTPANKVDSLPPTK